MRARLRLGVLSTVLLVMGLRTARAEERVPFRVEYVGGTECPNTEGFSAQLLARSAKVRQARSEEPALVFRVELGGTAGALVGRLTLLEPSGRATVRVVPGTSCEELTSAMGVIAAVLVDAQSPSSTAVREPPQPRATPQPRPHRTSHWRAGGGMGLVVEGAVAPDPAPGLSVEATLAVDRSSILSPSIALAFERTLSRTVTLQNGTARFQWNALRVTACPLRWPASGWLALRPCAVFDAGLLHADGESTPRDAHPTVPWFAMGGVLRAEALVRRPLFLTLDGGVVAPFRHDRFYFDPDSPSTTAFSVPGLGGVAHLGVSAQFW